jgi:hypothetical protein
MCGGFGLAQTLRKPKLPQAGPKPGLLGQAGPGKSLGTKHASFSFFLIIKLKLAMGLTSSHLFGMLLPTNSQSSAWKSSLKTAKKPRPNLTQTD